MKTTVSWLKDHLQSTASLGELVSRLTNLGLEVEAVENIGEDLEGFKVVDVIDVNPHPDADRLSLCKVHTDEGVIQVVCGAMNVKSGMKAVLAKSGSIIPATGRKLTVARIRGAESHGMLCSLADLNLGENAEVIIEAPDCAQIGESYAQVVGLGDPVIDLRITPNRGDCFGVYGIARDLAASGIGSFNVLKENPVSGTFRSTISINLDFDKNTENSCPFYVGRLIRSIKNGQSPFWLQKRLRAIGLQPISTLVDITNYMAYDIGCPMHIFDADKLQGDALTIRLAKSGEIFKAFDEKEYSLDETMTVITDDSGVQALGGIMVGEESACTEETTNVFLEFALFDPIRTAASGRKLNILSDSRYRFERGIDAALIQPAMELSTRYILNMCGGEVSNIVVGGCLPKNDSWVKLRPSRVEALGGVAVKTKNSQAILKALGFELKVMKDDVEAKVPSWRHDIHDEADLVEEILRMTGYDYIPATPLPRLTESSPFESYPGQRIKRHRAWIARRALAARGLMEAVTSSFLKSEYAELFSGGQPELVLDNPISADLAVMRSSLLPNLIDACRWNKARGLDNAAFFEVGASYHSDTESGQSLIVAGVRSGMTSERHWLKSVRNLDIFDAKKDVLAVFKACGIKINTLQTAFETPAWYHPGRSGELRFGPKNVLGSFGEIHPNILSKMDVEGPIVGFEISLSNLPIFQIKRQKPELKLSPYPSVERDFSFIVDNGIKADQLLGAVRRVNNQLITRVHIFDVYQGENVPKGKKSIALAVRLEPTEATLVDKEIQDISQRIIESVQIETGGELRS